MASEKAMRFSDLKQRLYTAAALIGGILFLEYAFQTTPQTFWCFAIATMLFIGLCSVEFMHLCEGVIGGGSRYLPYALVTFAPSLIFFLSYFFDGSSSIAQLLGLGVGALFVSLLAVGLMGRRSLEHAKIIGLELLFGSILIGLGGVSLLHLTLLPSHALLFWVVIIVAFNDTGAYFIGKYLGKTKLSPYISPGKSVEGAFGGLAVGTVIGVVLASCFLEGTDHSPLQYVMFIVSSITVGIFSQVFDLAKSFMKRIAGVKDSGTLLPGHGGFLDRLDGVLGGALALHMLAAITGIGIL